MSSQSSAVVRTALRNILNHQIDRRHCQPYRCSSPVDAALSCLRFLPPAQHARDFYGKVDSHPGLPAPRSVMYLPPGHSQPRPWLSAVPEQKTEEGAAGIKTTTRNKRAGKERAARRGSCQLRCAEQRCIQCSNRWNGHSHGSTQRYARSRGRCPKVKGFHNVCTWYTAVLYFSVLRVATNEESQNRANGSRPAWSSFAAEA